MRHFSEVDSTNGQLKVEAKAGNVPEGTVFTTDFQTNGRGRLDRRWESPPGQGLLFSLLLFPELPPDQLPLISLMGSMAVLDGILKFMEEYPIRCDALQAIELKWPNDLIVDGRKICGILSETGLDNQRRRFFILGIGLNVNQTSDDFPEPLQDTAVSLRMIVGFDLLRDHLLRYILKELEECYNRLKVEGSDWIAPLWLERSRYEERSVTVMNHKRKITGIVVGLESNGALKLRISGDPAKVETIYSGDVTSRCSQDQ
ncbi:MAG: biotin--[acetyl-CoA-carboxylase] ligase [Candidatus Electryoneaceae bacterium]|nr:biotin--[acetyl-CoA-carboxylase] ligase [Candidatus Electryoneaceae bacterium]